MNLNLNLHPVPDPIGGVITVGDETIIYIRGHLNYIAIAPHQFTVCTSLHTCVIFYYFTWYISLSNATIRRVIVDDSRTQSSCIVCYGRVDTTRYLLGDMAGNLFMLALETTSPSTSVASSSTAAPLPLAVRAINLQRLGEVRSPTYASELFPFASCLDTRVLENRKPPEYPCALLNSVFMLLNTVQTTIPETITYVDNGVVFIGSRLGDSQLLRVSC